MNFRHVSLDHDMREAARSRECPDVFVGRLRIAAQIQRQSPVQEPITRARANVEELPDCEFFQGCSGFVNALQVFTDNASVNLADGCFDLTGAMILDLDLIQAFVRLAATQGRDVEGFVHGRAIVC